MNRAAGFLLVMAAIPAHAQAPKADQAPLGWSFATEGSGVPRDQNAGDYAVEIDRGVARGGKASVTIRSVVEKPSRFRGATQFVKADAYRGKRVRLAGYLKTRDVVDVSGLWLRVDGPTSMLGFDDMDDRQVKGTTDWTRYELALDVPESAMRLAFGPFLMGAGQAWVDDLTLEVVDPREVKSTRLVQYLSHHAERASNLDFETTETAPAVPGWAVHGHGSTSYSWRVAEGGAHGGHGFLEAKSTGQGTPTVFSAAQNIVATPYRGKRLRFRAFAKVEGVTQEAYLSLEVWGKNDWIRRSNLGRGSKGQADWQAQEIVVDMPADAEILGLAANLAGAGTLGVDDVSVEVVDPAKVAVTPESDREKTAREKRTRELAEVYPRLPDRPENLDFEK